MAAGVRAVSTPTQQEAATGDSCKGSNTRTPQFLFDDLLDGFERSKDLTWDGVHQYDFYILALGCCNAVGYTKPIRGHRQQGTLYPYIWRTSYVERHPLHHAGRA